ncbi:MAG: hypothetical protein LBT40_16440 [Deltaproteobacteria bacterium]|jgi:hypothetical protein|nr:hypothetical protein [Deltaproteobacteria bacterium]
MMDTQIFNLKLSVNATSLYILLTELAEFGVRPTREEIAGRFAAGSEETETAIRDLLLHRVIYANEPGGDVPLSFHANPASLWVIP